MKVIIKMRVIRRTNNFIIMLITDGPILPERFSLKL
jgi:hypothetical protein